MKIVLVAEESVGKQVLKELSRRSVEVAAVLTETSRLKMIAKREGIPVLPPSDVRDPELPDRMRQWGVDLVLNVHSLVILPRRMVKAVRGLAFNLHPGPLPEIAGLNAPSWAIYKGERKHGVTVHWMAPKIDAGPIAYQARFPIEETDTGLSLSLKCIRHGLPLVMELVDAAAESPENIPMLAQDLSLRTYYGREIPQHGRLDWCKPAREVVDFVRAANYHPFRSPWGTPSTPLGQVDIGILEARPADASRNGGPPGLVLHHGRWGVVVAAGDAAVEVVSVQVNGSICAAREVLQPGTLLGPAPQDEVAQHDKRIESPRDPSQHA